MLCSQHKQQVVDDMQVIHFLWLACVQQNRSPLLASGQAGERSDVVIWNTETLTQIFR